MILLLLGTLFTIAAILLLLSTLNKNRYSVNRLLALMILGALAVVCLFLYFVV